jgi:hypothetical protein
MSIWGSDPERDADERRQAEHYEQQSSGGSSSSSGGGCWLALLALFACLIAVSAAVRLAL